jgi:hypothetical protein
MSWYTQTTISEKHITEYKLVRNGVNQIGVLEEEINRMIDHGWDLHGDLRIIDTENGRILMQPMVLYLKSEEV